MKCVIKLPKQETRMVNVLVVPLLPRKLGGPLSKATLVRLSDDFLDLGLIA